MRKINFLNIKLLDLLGIVLAFSLVSCIPYIIRSLMMIIIFLILIIFNINKIKRGAYGNRFFVLLVFFVTVNLFSNVLNQGDINWYVMQFYIMNMCFFIWLCYKSNDFVPIYVFVNSCDLWLMVSFVDVTIKITSKNYNEILLLCGYDNGIGAYVLPIIILNLYFILNGHFNFWMILNTVLAVLQIVMIWSATSMVGTFLILMAFLKSLSNRQSTILTPFKCYFSGILIFVFVIIFRAYDNRLVRWIVEDVLHRTLTFTGRIYIWDKALLYISHSLIFGHGRSELLQRIIFNGVSSAHNFYLDILCQSGIIGTAILNIVFIYIIFLSRNTRSSGQNFLICGTFLLVLTMQFESYCAYPGYPLLFFLISFCGFVCKMDISNKNDIHTVQNKYLRR